MWIFENPAQQIRKFGIVTQMTITKLCKSVQSARRTNIWKTIVLSRGHGTSSQTQPEWKFVFLKTSNKKLSLSRSHGSVHGYVVIVSNRSDPWKSQFWVSFRCNKFVINFITKLLQGKYAFRLSKFHPNIILSPTLDPQTNCASNQTPIDYHSVKLYLAWCNKFQ